MDIGLTSDQQLLRDTARRFIADFCPIGVVLVVPAPSGLVFTVLSCTLMPSCVRFVSAPRNPCTNASPPVTDVVFGVKDKLIVEFEKHGAGKTPTGEISSEPFLVVNYDFILSKAKSQSDSEPAFSHAAGLSSGKL